MDIYVIPFLNPLPPPSLYHPSGSSQCTSPSILYPASNLDWRFVSYSCNSMNCNPPGSSVHGIFQSRGLEWVAIFFSRGSSQPRDRTPVSCIAGGFLHCRQIFNHLSHQGSPPCSSYKSPWRSQRTFQESGVRTEVPDSIRDYFQSLKHVSRCVWEPPSPRIRGPGFAKDMAEGSKLASQVWWPVSLLILLLTWVSDYMPCFPTPQSAVVWRSIDAVLPAEDIWLFNIEGVYD